MMKTAEKVTMRCFARVAIVAAILSLAGAQAADVPDSQTVLQVQTQLQQLGFYNGPLDGKFDALTEDALRRYQYANHLPASGEMDDLTLARLGQADQNNAGSDNGGDQQPGVQSETVLQVQVQLHQLGFYDGPLDGKFDVSTEDALRRYQYANHLPASGKIDDLTLAKLGQGDQTNGSDNGGLRRSF
jgi:peptidoglycan hydrolase-like protein with peptidoglycan-binding domain